jgi:hypothetical protein
MLIAAENFQFGMIYKLVSPSTEKIYVGATIQVLSDRLNCHKSYYEQFNNLNETKRFRDYTQEKRVDQEFRSESETAQDKSFELLKFSNTAIVLIENYPCQSKPELHARLRYYVNQYRSICVNDVSDENQYEKNVQFERGRVYKISSPQIHTMYIGSTYRSLAERLEDHMKDYKKFYSVCQSRKRPQYLTSFEILKYPDAKMELLETFLCKIESEILLCERYHLDRNRSLCVNINNPVVYQSEKRKGGRSTRKSAKDFKMRGKKIIPYDLLHRQPIHYTSNAIQYYLKQSKQKRQEYIFRKREHIEKKQEQFGKGEPIENKRDFEHEKKAMFKKKKRNQHVDSKSRQKEDSKSRQKQIKLPPQKPKDPKEKYLLDREGKKILNPFFIDKQCSICNDSNPFHLCYNKHLDKIVCGNCQRIVSVKTETTRFKDVDIDKKIKENIGQCQIQGCTNQLVYSEMFYIRFTDPKISKPKDKRRLRKLCEQNQLRIICVNCSSYCSMHPQYLRWDPMKKEKVQWSQMFDQYIQKTNTILCDL